MSACNLLLIELRGSNLFVGTAARTAGLRFRRVHGNETFEVLVPQHVDVWTTNRIVVAALNPLALEA